jgi:hypothetical protein
LTKQKLIAQNSFLSNQIRSFQIGDSPLAPHFSIVSQSSKQVKEAGATESELAED